MAIGLLRVLPVAGNEKTANVQGDAVDPAIVAERCKCREGWGDLDMGV